MDQTIRNKLRSVVTQCRKLLEDAVGQTLQGQFGIYSGNKGEVHVEDETRMMHLSEEDQTYRKDILDHFEHIKARGSKPKEALEQLIREIAFTHLNRLCAYKLMEARQVWIGGQRFREALSRGQKSRGFMFYLADHAEDEARFQTGQQDVAYRHFLDWLGDTLSEEIGVLFDPHDPANRLYPAQRVLDEVLALINSEELAGIWAEDETLGWVYQYFTPKELRDQARKESAAPRNSYELAFRNQFFTPRYVVEFLTDNTLGRIWYEMRKGDTKLKDQCRYRVRRPTEIFLNEGQNPPKEANASRDDISQDELLKQPVYVPYRLKKDPRDLKILDPACGSGHFLLYCFDLLQTIYVEAYDDPDLSPALKKDYSTLDDLRREVPGLILSRNLHGIDIDLRATQIAALALWLRCQRAYQEIGLQKDRPKIIRSNIVCAEQMPGEKDMLNEFIAELQPKVLGQLLEVVFDKMQLAGEAGSLLKIEAELRGAVAEAKRQWLAAPKEVQLTLFDARMKKPQQDQQFLFDTSDITDAEFWDEAEAKVLASLRDYATQVENGRGHKRQLFADDTARGFAFIDICQKCYDIALMNPPFGDPVPTTREYIATCFLEGKGDICAAEVQRALTLLEKGGMVGAITTRTALFVQHFAAWRESIFDSHAFSAVADLGYGVLDAMVETAMYVIQKGPSLLDLPVDFIRTLTSVEKEALLLNTVRQNSHEFRAMCRQGSFRKIPGIPMAYWVPASLLSFFEQVKSFNGSDGYVCVGVQTGDNLRFLRLFWEVPTSEINTSAPSYDSSFATTKWLPFSKGGEYSPWWDDIHLLVCWQDGGAELSAHPSSRPQNIDFFFKSGGTYPYRTTSGFAMRCLPSGCGFSQGGWGVFPPAGFSNEDLLAFYNSRVARYFMEILLGQGDSSVSGSAARNYGNEAVGGVPWLPQPLPKDIRAQVKEIVSIRRRITADETCVAYAGPMLSPLHGDCLMSAARGVWLNRCDTYRRIAMLSQEIDTTVTESFRINPDDLRFVEEEEGRHPCAYLVKSVEADEVIRLFIGDIGELINDVQTKRGSRRYIVKKAYFVDRAIDLICHYFEVHPDTVIDIVERIVTDSIPFLRDAAEEWVSFAVGGVFGRWDIRHPMGKTKPLALPDPFDPLPVCSPARLLSDNGVPAYETPDGYRLRIDWDGILVDDPDHQDDIIRRIRDVLELIWKDQAHVVEKETCEILSIKELRDYFRKPSKDSFWDDHIKRYSKSRRKAPIYWFLQSSKKNYALWIYYHRLDRDILFKALLNYVEPKIRLEENRLEPLRAQRAGGGASGKGVKKLEKDIDRQEEFISELRDFEDKLRRVANLHLDPDLNDGVVLNIAPLWELVPWKEAKNYWEELLDGKYEWSSIGKQLRQRGLAHSL